MKASLRFQRAVCNWKWWVTLPMVFFIGLPFAALWFVGTGLVIAAEWVGDYVTRPVFKWACPWWRK